MYKIPPPPPPATGMCFYLFTRTAITTSTHVLVSHVHTRIEDITPHSKVCRLIFIFYHIFIWGTLSSVSQLRNTAICLMFYRLRNNNQTDQGDETEGLERERFFADFTRGFFYTSLNSRGGSAKLRWVGRWARSASFCVLKSLKRRVHRRARAAKTNKLFNIFCLLV
jgi:hypothetical protein